MEFTSTQQTVSWFRDRYLEGTLVIKPPYQRKPVWGARQKCHLVESVLKGYPVPELFVQKVTNEEGVTTFAVVDGQQRVRALMQFVGSDPTEDQVEYDRFALDKLAPESDWHGSSFADLKPIEKVAFFSYELAVRFLNTTDESEMKDVFRRLNRYTVSLTPQELRHATYEGPFARLVESLAEEFTDRLAENRIVTAAAIRRMGDVELIAELLAASMYGPQAGSPKSIDEIYENFEDYEEDFPGQRSAVATFRSTFAEALATIPDLRISRWSNKSDFYSLFTVLAHFARENRLPFADSMRERVRDALVAFDKDIDKLVADDKAPVASRVTRYVRNVQRGANDKARRAERNSALLEIMRPIVEDEDI